MQRITFSYPAGAPTQELIFSNGIELGIPLFGYDYYVPEARTLNATMYAYRKGAKRYTIPLAINLMSTTERNNLRNWFLNVAEGPRRIFNYKNQDSYQFNVRFLDSTLEFGEGTYPYSVSMLLFVEEFI
jgi:hypothetical protein